jgi:hypothetical protein
MLHTTIRGFGLVVGGLLFLGGVAAIGVGGPDAPAGVWGVLFGSALIIVAVLQRSRYRSNAAEQSHSDPGPGGGELDILEARFTPTTELFVDPTSRRLMRVYVDPRTGERRYRAEA